LLPRVTQQSHTLQSLGYTGAYPTVLYQVSPHINKFDGMLYTNRANLLASIAGSAIPYHLFGEHIFNHGWARVGRRGLSFKQLGTYL